MANFQNQVTGHMLVLGHDRYRRPHMPEPAGVCHISNLAWDSIYYGDVLLERRQILKMVGMRLAAIIRGGEARKHQQKAMIKSHPDGENK